MSIFGRVANFIHRERKIPIPYGVGPENLLEGRVALISGGGSGIGFSIAEIFLKHGAKVIIAGRNEKKLIEACEKLKTPNSLINYVCMDISYVSETESKVQRLFAEYGSIDILVNSAGMHYTESFGKVTEAEFNSIIDTNIKGAYFLTQVVSNLMIEHDIHGNVLNISSSSGLRPAWGPYQISKWAINGMTKGFADKLLKYGIIVNSLAPGQTATPMLNVDLHDINNDASMLGRYIVPDEVANIALFLVSDMGRIIIGDTIYASGGSGVVNSHR